MIDLDLPNPGDARNWWWTAKPFPYVVLDGVLDHETAATCAAEFPPADSTAWHTFTGPLEEGKQEGAAAVAGPTVAALHDDLASDDFVNWLRFLTGVQDLIPDPDRVGGGIHQCGPGGRLGLHVDFNLHPRQRELVRAVNLILFVGDHDRWDRRWGGLLELGDAAAGPSMTWRREVFPMPGTLVIFEASDTSWHGHPVPMSADCPVLRRSIPAYYYRRVRAGEQIEAHSTIFLTEGAT